MQTTVFKLDEEVHRALRVAAFEAGISMGEALRQAVALWLQEQKKAAKGERRAKK